MTQRPCSNGVTSHGVVPSEPWPYAQRCGTSLGESNIPKSPDAGENLSSHNRKWAYASGKLPKLESAFLFPAASVCFIWLKKICVLCEREFF